MKKKNNKLSKPSILHIYKLIYRSILFLSAAILYLYNYLNKTGSYFGDGCLINIFSGIIWIIFIAEMVIRFFPTTLESPGCQKHLKQRFKPTTKLVPTKQSWKRPLFFAFVWIFGNSIFGLLYLLEIIDAGILVLLCLLYGIGDMVSILFFCPFQTWFIKNRCCTDCRIYNWDFAMMFTPLIFLPHLYTYSLFGVALVLLVVWEVSYKLHPERFSENTNANLSCENCYEKLCQHKKHLKKIIINNKTYHL